MNAVMRENRIVSDDRLERIESEISGLRRDVNDLQKDVAELKANVRHIQADVVELKTDVREMRADLAEFKQDVAKEFGSVRVLRALKLF
jgi:peptidoglycan hydrolase CwlO-like protein